jgi:phage terminase large subunit-like protein
MKSLELSQCTTGEYISGSFRPLEALLESEARRRSRNKIDQYYPEKGPLGRDLYKKHMEFFAAGRDHRERLFLAGNRCGKTEGAGAYEMALHLTGRYPTWWVGRRFDHAIQAWAAGDTNQTTRDILQAKLLETSRQGLGTGMIPGDTILSTRPKSGIPGAIEVVYVQHVSGGVSVLHFKSFESGRECFQGTEQHVVWLDEEPPEPVYTECLMRTTKTGPSSGGILAVTFTPLNGHSAVVGKFLNEPERAAANRHVTRATWDDVPHLSTAEKAEMLAKLPLYQRDARTKGIPQLGSGAIYPVPESDIVVPRFEIPAHWPRAYGLDVGYNRTAAVFGAKDPESGVIYLYSEHYVGREEPVIHAQAIRARGDWIRGVIDPAARGRGQADGRQLLQNYKDLGLDVELADNSVYSGIEKVWQLLSGGMLKVFADLTNWLREFRLYRWDEKGHVVKEADHLMDATRYLVNSGRDRMTTKPVESEPELIGGFDDGDFPGGWMS